jgi:hypothetical protein
MATNDMSHRRIVYYNVEDDKKQGRAAAITTFITLSVKKKIEVAVVSIRTIG